MATSKQYLAFIMDQLASLDDVSYRAMMGEYVLYYRGKIFGGLYDDRLLVKPVDAALTLLPNAPLEKPYEGAKPMVLVEDVDNRAFLQSLLQAVYEDLPAPKTGRRTP